MSLFLQYWQKNNMIVNCCLFRHHVVTCFITWISTVNRLHSFSIKIPISNCKCNRLHIVQMFICQSWCQNVNYLLQYSTQIYNHKCTLLSIRGESSANHVSCLSDWQWAKQEFMNNPLCVEAPKPLIAFSISFLKSVPKLYFINMWVHGLGITTRNNGFPTVNLWIVKTSSSHLLNRMVGNRFYLKY